MATRIIAGDTVQYDFTAPKTGRRIIGTGIVTYVGRENGRASYWVTKPGNGAYLLNRDNITLAR